MVKYIPCEYKVLQLLGEGLSSEVYLVESRDSIGSQYAVKVLKNSRLLKNFISEFRKLNKLRSRYFPKSIAFGRDKNSKIYWHIQEYIDGICLKQLLEQELQDSVLLEIAFQLKDGLNVIKELADFHGDIKPENILFDRRGQLVFIDWGASNESNCFQYSPDFCSEKVFETQSYSHSGDRYAIGQVFVELSRKAKYQKTRETLLSHAQHLQLNTFNDLQEIKVCPSARENLKQIILNVDDKYVYDDFTCSEPRTTFNTAIFLYAFSFLFIACKSDSSMMTFSRSLRFDATPTRPSTKKMSDFGDSSLPAYLHDLK